MLSLRAVEFPFTHDLGVLLEVCEQENIDTPQELASVDDLSPFAVRLRYDTPPPTRLDREEGLAWAACAVAWARSVIEQSEARDEPPRKPDPGQGAPTPD